MHLKDEKDLETTKHGKDDHAPIPLAIPDADTKTQNTDNPDDLDSIELTKKKQDRLSKVLAQVDTQSKFTQNVNSLLQNSEKEHSMRIG